MKNKNMVWKKGGGLKKFRKPLETSLADKITRLKLRVERLKKNEARDKASRAEVAMDLEI